MQLYSFHTVLTNNSCPWRQRWNFSQWWGTVAVPQRVWMEQEDEIIASKAYAALMSLWDCWPFHIPQYSCVGYLSRKVALYSVFKILSIFDHSICMSPLLPECTSTSQVFENRNKNLSPLFSSNLSLQEKYIDKSSGNWGYVQAAENGWFCHAFG